MNKVKSKMKELEDASQVLDQKEEYYNFKIKNQELN